ncbi:MAG: DUF5107 domain-containing protein [Planctomycetia bacterium]|nr:DUF5107 domain-containing protein [Planctomycetia bacterium]
MNRSLLCITMILGIFLFLPPVFAETAWREYEKEYTTYPYSDPNPIPNFTKFYPYFRFDGFSGQARKQAWKVIELSNDFLTLEILPEIGGKIWTVKEKSTGRSIVYSNPVIKFRDVAMRGPWTSGGIEVNLGIIGHTPNCSSPVDYFVRKNKDQSVSCFIGNLDLIARAPWTVEINLPDKSSVFSMKICWHNGSGQFQPYYTWTNIGVPSGEGIECIDPGTKFIGHEGDSHPWSLDPKTGKDLAWYKNNDSGSYKSYHLFGRFAEFYGIYDHKTEFGASSYIPGDGKRGRKIWLWGLSREGMIWEDLLTDPPGKQYIEIQAGRLFNQCRGESRYTPFKNRDFPPYSTEYWTEYWMPVLKIGGFNAASSYGSMNVRNENGRIQVAVSPNRMIESAIKIFDGNEKIFEQKVSLIPCKPCFLDWKANRPIRDLKVSLGEDLILYTSDKEKETTRPDKILADPQNTKSPSALYLLGREAQRERKFDVGDQYFRQCIKADVFYGAAYAGLAENANRRGDYSGAMDLARKALAIDTYDPVANYQFGIAAFALKKMADAKEAFSLASLSTEFRGAALTELAGVYLFEKNYAQAREIAEKALVYNTINPDANAILLALHRIMNTDQGKAFDGLSQKLLSDNPLAFSVRFERFLAGKENEKNLCDSVRSELPHEIFLENAIRYVRIGRSGDALRILELALKKSGIVESEIRYWIAYLRKDPAELSKAENASLGFAFPFRAESIPVFRWAYENGKSWKNGYLFAVLLSFLGDRAKGMKILDQYGKEPDYPPFYVFRGSLNEKSRLNDYRRAHELDPGSPRYAVPYIDELIMQEKNKEALILAEKYVKKFPGDTRLILLYARSLLLSDQYENAHRFLRSALFLPNEGSLKGRDLYREAALMSAWNYYRKNQFDQAIKMIDEAREWPENLGAGKPYPNLCDERLEDWIAYRCEKARGNQVAQKRYLDAILQPADEEREALYQKNPCNEYLKDLALKASGRKKEIVIPDFSPDDAVGRILKRIQ